MAKMKIFFEPNIHCYDLTYVAQFTLSKANVHSLYILIAYQHIRNILPFE